MTVPFPSRRVYTIPLPQGRVLQLGERPLVMGIINVTPDSFGEAEPSVDPGRAIEAALRMEAEGADLVDIGGESTRPGADPVSPEEEAGRVLPVVDGLQGRLRIPISVDTTRSAVAVPALRAGAAIVNDVSGLRRDPGLGRAAAEYGAALVLMHSRGDSKTMYAQAQYGELIAEVAAELRESLAIAKAAGVPAERLIVDPGVGFAKRPVHSYGVLARLAALAPLVERPLLVGPSRKSFMIDAVGERPAGARDWGTAAAVTAAVLAGAHIIRVHAVAEMVQVVRVAEQIRRHA